MNIMSKFVDLLKKNRLTYTLVLSLVTTIVLVNQTLAFVEKVSQSVLLTAFSILVFYFLFRIAVEEKIWRV